MKLVPTQPPGRITRKARDFEADIVQLRAQGYTLDAIRQALAGVGVHVSISTVRREATRHAASAPIAVAASGDAPGASPASPPAAPTASAPAAGPVSAPAQADPRSGKDIAEAFVRNRITNPLIRSKEQR
jgi:hypothetical protein